MTDNVKEVLDKLSALDKKWEDYGHHKHTVLRGPIVEGIETIRALSADVERLKGLMSKPI